MICSDMVVVRRGVKQGLVSFVEDHLSQGLQSLLCYVSQDLFVYAIGVLVELNKVSIIAIMHEYAYLGKDKFFHSSTPCKNITIKSMTVFPSLPYAIMTMDTEVNAIFWKDVCEVLICYHGNGLYACTLCLLHLDNVGSSVPQVIPLWIYLKGEQSQGEHTADLDVSMNSTLLEKSQGKHKIESIVPMGSSSPEQSQGELPPDQVKIMEIQAVRLDASIGYKTVHLFPVAEGEYHCLSKDAHRINKHGKVIDGYHDEAQSIIAGSNVIGKDIYMDMVNDLNIVYNSLLKS